MCEDGQWIELACLAIWACGIVESHPGLQMQVLLSEVQTWGKLAYPENCILHPLAFAWQ